ncbi:DUF1963 domain-containing protein [Streptomyces harbinensis]|uniref:DUF1963 domain-containing protein n=1 Tax=Streptomyces harbinensis TaxID=1176198 RepID=A0A1I6PWA7_9ACTN|nr:DUF1963 domain-containing protein [Streptomyces harbinensis]SFS44483.1 protein of unknown function [Streptomyces harbinensis]
MDTGHCAGHVRRSGRRRAARGADGGDPVLPDNAPDPCHPLIARVDCPLIPPGATGLPLPAAGHLLFFADPELGLRGPMSDAVRHVPAGTPAAVRRVTAGRGPFEPQDMRTMWHHLSPPMPESFAEARWEDPDDEEYELAEELESAWTHVGGSWPTWTFALGAHPVVINDDPLRLVGDEAPDGGDWALLATWRCDERAGGLDAAVVSWMIRRQDLASSRFDRVYVHVDRA